MFTSDPNITEKDLKDKSLSKLLVSMNSHQVATPETSLEDARSYVFFFREGKKKYSAYIGLHLLLSDRKLIYAYSTNPFFEDKIPEVEGEARDFAEYIGAMMDEVDIAGMSDLELESYIEEQEFFRTKTESEAAPQSPAVREQLAQAPEPVSVVRPSVTPEQAAPVRAAVSDTQQPAVPEQPTPVPGPVAQSPIWPDELAPASEPVSVAQPPVAPEKPAPAPEPVLVAQPPAAPEQPAPARASVTAVQPPVVPEQPAARATIPVPQPPAVPKQPAAPVVEAKRAPEPPAAQVRRLPKIYSAETQEQPRKDHVAEMVQREVQAPSPPTGATKRRQENEKKDATNGTEPTLKQTKMSYSATSVVSRDREALARLLTSF